EELAQEEGTLRQPPASLVLLANILTTHYKSPAAAERLLRQAQQEHPDDFWINLELAQMQVLKKPPAWAEAVPLLRAALALRPQSPVVLTNLGNALRRQGKLPEALAAIRKAIEFGPDLAPAYAELGTVLSQQGAWADAEASARKALELNPRLAGSHNLLGI